MNLLLQLQNFLDTLQDQDAWLESWRREVERIDIESPHRLHLVGQQGRVLAARLRRIVSRLRHGVKILGQEPKLGQYVDHINKNLLTGLEELAERQGRDHEKAIEQIRDFAWPRKPNKKKDTPPNGEEFIKDCLDRAKKELQEAQIRFAQDSSNMVRQLKASVPQVQVLLNLHRRFAERYEQVKRQQNTLDFSDLEHKCLLLLREEGGEDSDIARQLQRRYRYVLVDEYQDISPVQEAIIGAVSGGTRGGGNLFMVGDVKQSIYGFRQAEPAIFLEKFRTFTPLKPVTEGGDTGQGDGESQDDGASQGDGASQSDGVNQVDGKKPTRCRIDLNRNFRSRRRIVRAINTIFDRCMSEEFGGIDYAGHGRLEFGATYYETPDDKGEIIPDGPVEIHLIESKINYNATNAAANATSNTSSHQQELEASQREAAIVARRIRKMVGADNPEGRAEFKILDPQNRQVRPVQYRDIVVLLRSMKNRAEQWTEVFRRFEVPVHAELSSGYFVATEIQDVISLLKLLDNPRQDIPLASVLRSPLEGLNESELAQVRLHSPQRPYHEAVVQYAQDGPEATLRERLRGFLERLDGWRSRARRGSLAELIWTVYRQSHLLAFVRGLPDGRQRYQNLLGLHDRARQFDTFAKQGLARFLRFIEKLREEEGDFGPAPVLTEADNVVRLMSVHKSKGLEFPVVIVANTAQQFNLRDAKGQVLFDRSDNYPVGIKLVDRENQDRWDTLPRAVIAESRISRNRAEEMRVLYVALTRSRERLVVVGTVELEAMREKWRPWCNHQGGPLPEFLLSSARAPIEWLGPALAGQRDWAAFFGNDVPNETDETKALFKVQTYDENQVIALTDPSGRWGHHGEAKLELESLLDLDGEKNSGTELSAEAQRVINRINRKYPHHKLTTLKARASVTELKRPLDINEEFDFVAEALRRPDESPIAHLRPRFLATEPEAPTAAEKGTWTHQFLQRVNLEGPMDMGYLRGQLDKMVAEGFFTPAQSEVIYLERIAAFFADELGQALCKYRDSLQREWQFTLALPATQVYPDADLTGEDAEERILVRGIIDAFFVTPAGCVIVDFKTDHIRAEQCAERAKFYQRQMWLYHEALGKILRRDVVQLQLYFLTPGKAFQVPLPKEEKAGSQAKRRAGKKTGG